MFCTLLKNIILKNYYNMFSSMWKLNKQSKYLQIESSGAQGGLRDVRRKNAIKSLISQIDKKNK